MRPAEEIAREMRWDEMEWHKLRRWQWDAMNNFQEKLPCDEIKWHANRSCCFKEMAPGWKVKSLLLGTESLPTSYRHWCWFRSIGYTRFNFETSARALLLQWYSLTIINAISCVCACVSGIDPYLHTGECGCHIRLLWDLSEHPGSGCAGEEVPQWALDRSQLALSLALSSQPVAWWAEPTSNQPLWFPAIWISCSLCNISCQIWLGNISCLYPTYPLANIKYSYGKSPFSCRKQLSMGYGYHSKMWNYQMASPTFPSVVNPKNHTMKPFGGWNEVANDIVSSSSPRNGSWT